MADFWDLCLINCCYIPYPQPTNTHCIICSRTRFKTRSLNPRKGCTSSTAPRAEWRICTQRDCVVRGFAATLHGDITRTKFIIASFPQLDAGRVFLDRLSNLNRGSRTKVTQRLTRSANTWGARWLKTGTFFVCSLHVNDTSVRMGVADKTLKTQRAKEAKKSQTRGFFGPRWGMSLKCNQFLSDQSTTFFFATVVTLPSCSCIWNMSDPWL